MKEITVTIPIPHKATHPNARVHWAAKMRHAKKQRSDAYLASLAAMLMYSFSTQPNVKYQAKTEFYMRTNHSRDRDNLIAWLKPSFDGIADAKIVTNDALIVSHSVEVFSDKKSPRVEITIRPLNPVLEN